MNETKQEAWNKNIVHCPSCGIQWAKPGKQCEVCYRPIPTSFKEYLDLVERESHNILKDKEWFDKMKGAINSYHKFALTQQRRELAAQVGTMKRVKIHSSKAFPEHAEEWTDYMASDCVACDTKTEDKEYNQALEDVIKLLTPEGEQNV
jgi:predicted amidophosphoribosyltransferase